MFSKLKSKLKETLSLFSRKAEKEAEVEEIVVEKEVVEDIAEKELPFSPSSEKKTTEKEEPKSKKIEDKIIRQEKTKENFQKSEEKINEEPTKIAERKEETIKAKPDRIEETKEQPIEKKKGFFKRIFSAKEKKEDTLLDTKSSREKKEEITFSEEEIEVKSQKPAKTKIKPEIIAPIEDTRTHEIITVETQPENKEESEEESEEKSEEKSEKKSFFQKIKETVTTKKISADKFEELFWDLEIVLLESNVSVEVIEKIKEDLKLELVDKPLPRDVPTKIQETLKQTLSEILTFEKVDILKKIKEKGKTPFIIAFFGINGAGKTTSIAKLAYFLQQNKHSVVLAACDTFRAAAIQQLQEHADKLGVKMIKQDYGSDAAAVAFDAIRFAQKNAVDVVLIDTAGRLHSNTNLMGELSKIIRVTKPNLNIFVGESITGNDCIEQARKFNEVVDLDGVILTKADVDEKGGAPLSIAYVIKKPILFLGMGQKYSDLEEFDAKVIVERLGL